MNPVFSKTFSDDTRRNPYVSSKYLAIQDQLAKKTAMKNQYTASQVQKKRTYISVNTDAAQYYVIPAIIDRDYTKPYTNPIHIYIHCCPY
jgi:hypothetical protein